MELSKNQYTVPMNRQEKDQALIRDIDTVLLAEEQLLEALVNAVKYNSLEPAEAEQVLWDFRHQNGLVDVPTPVTQVNPVISNDTESRPVHMPH